ncbi:MAG: hypothetical protein ABFS14_08455 [Gemmatimonadota bacterium]
MSEPTTTDKNGSAALPEELADFLTDLASAYQKYSMYPPGHPALAPAVANVTARLADLLARRDSLVIAVAKDQLIIEGAATDRDHLLLSTLADRLSRHQLGVMIFTGEVAGSEIADLLSHVAVEPQRAERPMGQRPDLNEGRPNIRLHSMGYDKLEIREAGGSADRANVPCSRLWVLLADAALENSGDEERAKADPAAVAKAIAKRKGDETYDKVISGYLQTITREMRDENPALSDDLQRRVSGMVTRLDSDALQRLLSSMSGTASTELEFLSGAASQLSAEAIMDLLEAATEGDGRHISEGMMRVISKLARHASANDESQPRADAAMREQVGRLISNWNLEDSLPENYNTALAGMSAGSSSPGAQVDKAAIFSSDPERIVTMGLELEVDSDTVFGAADQMIGGDGMGGLFDLLDEAPADSGVAPQLWKKVSTRETLRQLTSVETPNFEWIDRLLPLLGEEAADPLLDALAMSVSRRTRRKLLDRIATLGPAIGPNLVARTDDVRWFVTRNMLSLLGTLPSLPDGFSPQPFLTHEHEMVRLEALKLSMRMPELRSAAIAAALAEEHERFATLAIAELEESWEPSALPWLRRLSLDPGAESRIRVPAIRCLARSGTKDALDTLLQIARVRRRFLFWSKLPPRSPELVAALSGLRSVWPKDLRVGALLKLGLRSSDPKIRLAAGGEETS